MTLSFILCMLGAYLLGSIPFGLILSKIFSKPDIRGRGSGNIGAANVARVLGKRLGLLTLLGDALKGFIPAWCGAALLHSTRAACAFGGAAFVGHLFPVYLRFRGGKGVATGLGVFLCLSPGVMPVAAAVFAVVVATSRYVALGSLACAALVPVLLVLLSFPLPVIVLSMLMGVLVFIKHRDNIQRLMRGTENRIG